MLISRSSPGSPLEDELLWLDYYSSNLYDVTFSLHHRKHWYPPLACTLLSSRLLLTLLSLPCVLCDPRLSDEGSSSLICLSLQDYVLALRLSLHLQDVSQQGYTEFDDTLVFSTSGLIASQSRLAWTY